MCTNQIYTKRNNYKSSYYCRYAVEFMKFYQGLSKLSNRKFEVPVYISIRLVSLCIFWLFPSNICWCRAYMSNVNIINASYQTNRARIVLPLKIKTKYSSNSGFPWFFYHWIWTHKMFGQKDRALVMPVLRHFQTDKIKMQHLLLHPWRHQPNSCNCSI